VELAAREQRDEGGVDVAAVVAPQEQPVLPVMPSSALTKELPLRRERRGRREPGRPLLARRDL
jgi:hypothetical protein